MPETEKEFWYKIEDSLYDEKEEERKEKYKQLEFEFEVYVFGMYFNFHIESLSSDQLYYTTIQGQMSRLYRKYLGGDGIQESCQRIRLRNFPGMLVEL